VAVINAGRGAGNDVVDAGTMVVINGPRFSSRAESRWHQQAGWTIVGMTGMPEASIARELAMCFTTIALVTDHDAGVEVGEGVTHAAVLEQFAANLPRLRELLVAALAVALVLMGGSTSYARRSGLVLLGGLIGSVFITMGDPIWFHMPWDYARAVLLYEIVSWALLGSVVAKLAPPPNTRAASTASPPQSSSVL